MDYFTERLIDGLTLGVVCAVLAVSYAIAGGVRRTLIFANTAYYFTGSAIAFCVFFGTAASGIRLGAVLTALLALVCTMTVSLIAAGTATDGLPSGIKASLSTQPLMISLGALFIAAGTLQLTGQLRVPQNLLPLFAPRLTVFVPGILKAELAVVQSVVLILGTAAIGAVFYVFRYGSFACRLRAIAQDGRMAELLGIDVARVSSISVTIASMAAALSGWMTAVVSGPTDITNALLLAACAFLGALLGGLGSVPKAAAGGFVVGLGDAFWSGYLGREYALPAIFAVLVFMLIFSRLSFGSAERVGEA